MDASDLKNAITALGILGATLGLSLGFVGGLGRRSLSAALAAACLGLVLGAAAAIAATFGLVPLFQRHYDAQAQTLTFPMLINGGIWSAIGAASGLALGIGLGGRSRIVRCLLGGLVGGSLGAAIYQVVGAVLFPIDKTFQPLSMTTSSRVVARLLAAISIASVAVIAIQVSARPTPSSPKPSTDPAHSILE